MGKTVKVDTRYLDGFLSENELRSYDNKIKAAHQTLNNKTGLGNDFLGWLDLPKNYDKVEFERIIVAAEKIKKDTDVFIVIGIGGSYLGARAAIEFLKSPLYNNKRKNTPDIYFAGNSISATAFSEIIELCEGRRVSVNVISKSGTTTEPAVAFRFFKDYLEKTFGKEEARERIYVTTDKARGGLKALADKEGYETFVVPDDVGGRFSVLTAVGLLPIAVAGCDIEEMMAGAALAMAELSSDDMFENDAYLYAATRNALHEKGRLVELMVSYEPNYAMMSEWWKQLYGESEGKDGKGIFPASVVFSTDLHSLGQFIQDGNDILFETVMLVDNMPKKLTIIDDPKDIDGLNFLSGQSMAYVNRKAFEGTVIAHIDGGTPSVIINIPDCSEHTFGYLVYFFEKACAISGYVLGVNPFDQPGVESYKKNMFALLGKPGYEKEKEALEKRIEK